jgi:hypothetical protein
MSFSQPEVLVALRKAKRITSERVSAPMHALYFKEIEGVESNYNSALKTTEKNKLMWHAEILDTEGIAKRAKDAFYKYRDVLNGALPAANNIIWPKSISSNEDIEVNLEKLIGIIEEHKDKLAFATTALDELHPLSDELDKEITKDQSAYRVYHNSIDQKDAALLSGYKLFLQVRRFIRRDLGAKSPEYSQLKDKAVRQAAQEEEVTPTPVQNAVKA